jgi:hypothetical protein
MGKAGDRISRAREPGQAVLHIAVPGGGHASLIVERELALRLAERRMEAGTTFAEMVRAGDPDLAQLVRAHIAELRAEHQGIDVGLARLAPAATLGSMATRRDSAYLPAATAPATGWRPMSRTASRTAWASSSHGSRPCG